MIADRINDIICRRENLPSLSDDEEFSCGEDNQEDECLLQPSVTSLQQKHQKISSNSFRLLKKLPSSYGRSNSFKEITTTNNQTHKRGDDDDDNDDDDALSDDSYGTENGIPKGSHDQEAIPTNENTLQLFDDNEDTNDDTQEKTKEPVIVSKRNKPSYGK